MTTMSVSPDQTATTSPAASAAATSPVEVYLVSANGGYESPNFLMTYDEVEARETYEAWKAEVLGEPGDRVDLVCFDGTHTVSLDNAVYGEEIDDDDEEVVEG